MVRNPEKRAEAIQFRKRGFTYAEIAKLCGVSKSTVSAWLSGMDFSVSAKQQNTERAARDNKKRMALLNKARAAERVARYREAVRFADIEFKHYRHLPLFMAGLAVYLSQGDMAKDTHIRLSTNREDAQRVFVRFARDFLGVENEQLRLWLLLHPAHTEAACTKRWARLLRVPASHFGKAQRVRSVRGEAPLHFGTLNTIIGSTVLKHKLTRWVELATKELTK